MRFTHRPFLVLILSAAAASAPAQADFTQQGNKLVGTGNASPAPEQGRAVALSADGNTLLLGGYQDAGSLGSAWVFTRAGSTWAQQGHLIVGDASFGAHFGYSVSLSADGNTALIGGYGDGAFAGAAWIFTRSGSTWTRLTKLFGTGATGNAQQGVAVALSADGNTALVGGNTDGTTGAVWVYTRSGATWTQQGTKLTGSGVTGSAINQGSAVALSADGNTALVGGNGDASGAGATWVFTRSGSTWTQQGTKLVGTGAVGNARQGAGVALSADGNTALIGAYNDNTAKGAAWVFTRSGSTWTQQGAKLVGTGATGSATQGRSAALSADGNTALIGGNLDNGGAGAAWVFTRSGAAWTQLGARLLGTGAVGKASQGQSVALSGDGATAAVGGPTDASDVGAAWVFTQPISTGPASLVSAVLPASRSVQVGNTATAFATAINTSDNAGIGCNLSLGTSLPASFHFQTTDPATNAVTGTSDSPVTIPAHGVQSFVFAIQPSAAINPTDVPINAACSNAAAATSVVGLNTLLLSASTSPVPDIVALAATAANDGIVNIAGTNGSGAFAVATVNVGAAGTITVSADTGAASLPVAINLCQTNPGSGQCTSAVGPTVTTAIAANATPTFAIFAQGAGNVAFDPANNRIFVRFKDGGGVVRGATSVAVRTQ